MNRGIVGSAVWALLLSVGLVGCSGPRVYQIAGDGDPSTACNVLFLGDGFSKSELDEFRRAASALADTILASEPICGYPHSVNFYRIDLISDPIGSDLVACPGGCDTNPIALTTTLKPPLKTHHKLGHKTLDVDLKTELCWAPAGSTTGDCKVLWTGAQGQKRAFDLALEAPNISVVVIIANTQRVSGAGASGAATGSIGLAVIGVPVASGGVSCTGYSLALHEIGHALGLLDEYPDASGVDQNVMAATFPTGRNVWRPADSCWEPPNPFNLGTATALGIPWAIQLVCPSFTPGTDCEQPDPTAKCTATGGPAQPWVPAHPLGANCVKDPSTHLPKECLSGCASPTPGCPCYWSTQDACRVQAGLWEGAYYFETGYYRAQDRCRMNRLDKPFCPVCTQYLSSQLALFGPPGPSCSGTTGCP